MISMIMATIGRKKEVRDFLDALRGQTLMDFEVIIVDQNPAGFLDEVLTHPFPFPVIHIHSEAKGLSANRNIGLNSACGTIVCFPDDDCLYYPDTIETAINKFSTTGCDILMGRIWDRKDRINIIKSWPTNEFWPARKDLYKISSSITIFSKLTSIKFDEQLGAGAQYPSNEDFDYVARSFESGAQIIYAPSLEMWHPQQSFLNVPPQKAFLYGIGFGYACKKLTKSSLFYFYLLLLASGFHAARLLKGAGIGNLKLIRYSSAALRGRLYGYLFA